MLTESKENSNIMVQDVRIDIDGVSVRVDGVGVSVTVRQSDLASLYQTERLSDRVLVYRVVRSQLGGGFGDQHKHPFAWAVIVHVDGRPARVISARGAGREWTSLDRLERWLREQGFRYWCVRNDLEPASQLTTQDANLQR